MTRRVLRMIAAIFFIVAGLNHFRRPGMYLRIMPPAFPYPTALVAVSGACEIAGGAGLLIVRLRRWASWGLVLLLAAVFPANLFMAMRADLFADLHLSKRLLWARLGLQPILMLWVWWVGLESRSAE